MPDRPVVPWVVLVALVPDARHAQAPECIHLRPQAIRKALVEAHRRVSPEDDLRFLPGVGHMPWLENGCVVEQAFHRHDVVPKVRSLREARRQARPGRVGDEAVAVPGEDPVGDLSPSFDGAIAGAVVVDDVVVLVPQNGVVRHQPGVRSGLLELGGQLVVVARQVLEAEGRRTERRGVVRDIDERLGVCTKQVDQLLLPVGIDDAVEHPDLLAVGEV